MLNYNPKKIEPKWQKFWKKKKLHSSVLDPKFPKSKRKYVLDMFPYPSAAGLHVGHLEGYTTTDIITRYLRMKGCNVLHPMGWDAFGLPAENYALKTGRHPRLTTAENIKRMKKQIDSLGFSYDWSREINTTDPEYYKWTQWIFLKMFKNGLAYNSTVPINWCPSCKTGLANEEVLNGVCERCGTAVTKKALKQWLLRITAYAERLLQDLEKLDWPEPIKEMQQNWIGRSEGVEINFKGARVSESKETWEKKRKMDLEYEEYDIPVFTTRIDTVFGITALILAPEHPLVGKLTTDSQKPTVQKFLKEIKKKSELERRASSFATLTKNKEEKEKIGVPLGASVVNPFTGEKVPVWISDYVLLSYGTGAVMFVPAHDQRDWEFARKYGLPVKWVIAPPHEKAEIIHEFKVRHLEKPLVKLGKAYEGPGYLINSGEFSGLTSEDAKVKLADYIESQGWGRRQVQYHLRDWIFSRQRYWGEPIPLVFCSACKKRAEQKTKISKNLKLNEGEILNPGWVAVPEECLPLKLPEVSKYKPTGTGESPLANIRSWVNVKCPKCGGGAKRETNTMPQWAGSCWYYLRYLDPKNKKRIFAPQKGKYWLPVDIYVGGAEHAVLHLLYARFWHKFLYDMGILDHSEPFICLKNQGLILGEDGQKMSKSRGNVIGPDEVVRQYGADTLRMYEMFMGPFEESKPWNTKGIMGIRRFLEKVWNLQKKISSPKSQIPNPDFIEGLGRGRNKIQNIDRLMHKTIKGVTEDIENFKFNTAISKMMVFAGELSKEKDVPALHYSTLLILLSPFAPHITEELWTKLGRKESIQKSKWPSYNIGLAKEEEIELVVQVNGKVRDKIKAPVDISEAEAKKIALSSGKVKHWLAGKEPKKVIFVRGRLVSIVV